MKQPGNGSSRFEVCGHDMGGWVRVIVSGPLPDDVGNTCPKQGDIRSNLFIDVP
jgi:hypothetical protein